MRYGVKISMMIRAEELRIGNLVLLSKNYKDNIHKVEEIYTDEVKVTSIEDGGCFPRMTMRSILPIPLDPEWLERCGLFENGSLYKGDLRFKGRGHLTIEVIKNGGLGYFAPFNKTIEIKYLHQLQNFYFALTGEELNVKL